jgi:hypothetical protein
VLEIAVLFRTGVTLNAFASTVLVTQLVAAVAVLAVASRARPSSAPAPEAP